MGPHVAPAAESHAENRMLSACLETLRALGASLEVDFVMLDRRDGIADGELRVRSPRVREARFVVEAKRTHLSYALASGIIEHARSAGKDWVLFAPYVPGPMGRHLAQHAVSYVDTVGNCHLEPRAGGLFIHVEGKRPARDRIERSGIRVEGYQLMFAILAESSLLSQPVRQIAAAAGIGKTAAAAQLNRLLQRGLLARTSDGYVILGKRELLDRWLGAYPDIVRPAWLHGRYRTQIDDPDALEAQIGAIWRSSQWAFGGGAAAWRMLPLYRSSETVLHVGALPTNELRELRALPSEDGNLTILRTPGNVAYAGSRLHLAHPLLVYTEMAASTDPRMREAATNLREQFLEELW